MDLNLFAVFAAIMRHGSVSRAAQSLGLTQPATSNALTRLRGQLGDPLFVRTKHGMLPTRFAAEMAPAIERALADLQGVARGGAVDRIELAGLRRNFTLVMSDLEEVLFERVFDPLQITTSDLRWRKNWYREHQTRGIPLQDSIF